nr:hypothetical protein CFP56_10032 [Quercus suber]
MSSRRVRVRLVLVPIQKILHSLTQIAGLAVLCRLGKRAVNRGWSFLAEGDRDEVGREAERGFGNSSRRLTCRWVRDRPVSLCMLAWAHQVSSSPIGLLPRVQDLKIPRCAGALRSSTRCARRPARSGRRSADCRLSRTADSREHGSGCASNSTRTHQQRGDAHRRVPAHRRCGRERGDRDGPIDRPRGCRRGARGRRTRDREGAVIVCLHALQYLQRVVAAIDERGAWRPEVRPVGGCRRGQRLYGLQVRRCAFAQDDGDEVVGVIGGVFQRLRLTNSDATGRRCEGEHGRLRCNENGKRTDDEDAEGELHLEMLSLEMLSRDQVMHKNEPQNIPFYHTSHHITSRESASKSHRNEKIAAPTRRICVRTSLMERSASDKELPPTKFWAWLLAPALQRPGYIPICHCGYQCVSSVAVVSALCL